MAAMLNTSAVPDAAAAPPQLPTTVLPEIRLPEAPPPPAPTAPPLTVPDTAPIRPPSGAETIRFVLTDLRIDGNSVYPEEELAPYYRDLIGQDVAIADLYKVAAAIQKRFREDGYFLTRVIVPKQTVRDGVFRLQVIEGFINDIKINGDVGPVRALVRRYLDNVRDRRPLALATLERYLLLCNDIPGITAVGTLQPSPTTVGAAELLVTVGRKPVEGFANVDNYGTEYTGLWEVFASVAGNSFTAVGEQVAVTGLVADPLNVTGQRYQWVGQGRASWRVGDSGAFIEALGSYGRSRPGFLVRDFDFDSRTWLATLGAGFPLVRSRDFNLTLRSGIDVINADTDIFDNDKFFRDRIRALRVGGVADFRDAYDGGNTLSAGVRRGLDIAGASGGGDDHTSRPGASNQVSILEAGASRSQPLGEGFALWGKPASLSLYGAAQGQYAFAPVLAYEEYELGGDRFGRGYDIGELSGDSALGATAELRFTHVLNDAIIPSYQLFGFYDYGRVWNRQTGPNNDLASAGAGLRATLLNHLSIELIGAKPLTLRSERASFTRAPQVLFRAVGRY